jgi:hypothetical protein
MSYDIMVNSAWKHDPDFVTLCKNLWGPSVTAEMVAKMNPDSSGVCIPGAGKKKKIPTLDRRGVTQAATEVGIEQGKKLFAKAEKSYEHMPKVAREYKRDDNGRFASGVKVAADGVTAAVGAGGGAVAGVKATGQARQLMAEIARMRRTAAGRKKLASAIIAAGGRTAGVASLGVLAGAVASHHGRQAYDEARNQATLERAHAKHVQRKVRMDDLLSVNYGEKPRNFEVATTGEHGRTAHTRVFSEGAEDVEYSVDNVPAMRDREQRLREMPAFAKRDVDMTGQITGVNEEKRQVFGWASIVEKDGAPVVDLQGDYIGIEELEKSAYEYVQKSRVGGAMHRRVDEDGNLIEKNRPYHAADLIESFVVTPEKIEKMGLPSSTPVGWWVGFKVNDDDVWGAVKSGDWKGFSIHGAGRRKTIGEISDMDITGAEITR